MSATTKIQWCHHTFNPWRGCEKVSAGCANCYAETLSHRNPSVLGVWGKNGARPVGSDSYWRQPIAWDRAAMKAVERRRVFCASLADVFEDRPDLVEPRFRLFALIERTPWLDWLLLTKRPENIERLWPAGSVGILGGSNIWLGTSVEDQDTADERIPHLLAAPAAVRFLSVEPLLGPVRPVLAQCEYDVVAGVDLRSGRVVGPSGVVTMRVIDWIIVGGESGPRARRCDVAWIRDIVSQGREACVPVFVKQVGSHPTTDHRTRPAGESYLWTSLLRDGKGGDPAEWPEDLCVREFPAGAP